MNYYLAPMESVTGYVFRGALQAVFGLPDKCFTPFITPNQKRCMNAREEREVAPENNQGQHLIPQVLTNRAEDFIAVCYRLRELGYQEVNLNLGCPSGTVVSKKRGSGFLSVPKQLDDFLGQIFYEVPMDISIKTRLGIEEPEEFFPILELYDKYPLKELIIHPRVQKEFYKNKPHMEVFTEALKQSRHKICYNGDLFTIQDIAAFQETFPQVESIMLGRGLVVNPGLLNLLQGQVVTKEQIREFHNRVVEGYSREMYGDMPVLHKMKELWFYMLHLFEDGEKLGKKIKKAQKLFQYEAAVNQLFEEKDLVFWEHIEL